MTDKKQIDLHVNNSYWFDIVHDNAVATYASGEIVGTLGELQVKGSGGGGIVLDINIIAQENQKMPIRIWFFRREPKPFGDGDTFLPTWNCLRKVAKHVDIDAGLYDTYGSLEFAQRTNINVRFSCPDDGTLYYYVEARGAGTFTGANRLGISFGDWPD